jgi:nucleotide-binding universal stress UspA family protein
MEKAISSKYVLAGLDGSVAGSSVADWAAARAQAMGDGLALVHVVLPVWVYQVPDEHALAVKRAEDLLRSEAGRVQQVYPDLDVVTTIATGEPAEALAALSLKTGLVVVGTDRGPGTEGRGFGCVSFQVAVTSRCPVAVIPQRAPEHGSGVVVGVDGSPDAARALELAAGEARRLKEELVIVHAPGPESGDGTDDVSSDSVKCVNLHFPDLAVRVSVDPGRTPAEALTEASLGARLLVIGRKGRGGLSVLVGSVAQHILLNLRCPTILS